MRPTLGRAVRFLPLLFLLTRSAAAQAGGNVVLVTFDGVRVQEFFAGLDTVIAHADEKVSGIHRPERLRADFWRDTPAERRRALMPFFWDSVAPGALVFGNHDLGSRVTLLNPHRFSAPGYLELLTGQYQPDVTTNDQLRYPHRTVLEYVRRRLGLPLEGVALFGSWENFRFYAASREGAVLVNAGYDSLPPDLGTQRLRDLARLQRRALALWEGSRLDAFTGAMALEYIRRYRPRLAYIAFNDTDDLAHTRRYDRVLDALHALDGFLADLVHLLDSMPEYRGRTTLILSTDHGRGRTPADWSDHGAEVSGAEDIWLVVSGPGTPGLGEVRGGPAVVQASVAATVLRCLGLDPAAFSSAAAPPVPGACGGGR
jgi:hypothetical protein